MLKTVAKFALFLATMAFLTATSLFLFSAWALTWPLMRKSPREQRIRATAEAAAACVSMIQVYAQQRMGKNNDGE